MLRLGEAMSILARKVLRAVGKLTLAHAVEQVEVFFDRAATIRAVLARLGQSAALLADLIRREVAHEGFAFLNELYGPCVELIEIIGSVKQAVFEIAAQPADVFNDRIDVLGFFLGRIGIVEAQVAFAAELARQAEVDRNRLGVADMQISVRLGRETRVHAALILFGLQIVEDDVPDEVGLNGRARCRIVFWRSHLLAIPQHLQRVADSFECRFPAQNF